MNQEFSRIAGLIDASRPDLVEKMSTMIGIRAISPKSGGDGEMRRAEYLQGILRSWGLETKRYDYTDDTGIARPNIITRVGGAERTIWFVGHMDTVSEGDRSLWKSDPFVAKVDGDMMYGRGTVDDGIGVFSAMFALKAMKDSGAPMRYNFGLALVSDEEMGSLFGMDKLVGEPGLFKKGDMFCVLDFWAEDGARIEIGEKGMLWLKITVNGKQVHASTPDEGKNAYRYAIKFIHEADEFLHGKYNRVDPLFEPDRSTFEMTKHEKNIDSINIIPGTDVSYIDCRVLPGYDPDEIVNDLKGIAKSDAYDGVRIEIERFSRTDAGPITSPESEIVNLIAAALKNLRHIDSRKSGIGGGTCASFARKAGMDAVAWGTSAEVAHQPNECVKITDIINDAKVLAYICLDRTG
jgi:succinyl-diaminopimelate desuccinylase